MPLGILLRAHRSRDLMCRAQGIFSDRIELVSQKKVGLTSARVPVRRWRSE
jgi:hypothetical protein